MAEAFLNTLYGDRFEAMSAGLEPGVLNPHAVRAMQEVGIDISNARTKSVFELYKAGFIYSYVITVCDPEAAARCPIFPGIMKRLQWSFPDPSQAQGTDEEKMAMVCSVRNAIRRQIEAWAPTVA